MMVTPIVSKAAEGVFGTAGKILQLGVDSRAVAMGGAYSAVANDHAALFWNPAGLAQVYQYEIAYMHNLWVGEIQDSYISYAQPLYGGGLAIGLNYFNFGEFKKFDIDANGLPIPLDKTYTPYTMVVSVGYGLDLPHVGHVGTAIKLVSENVDSFSSMSILVDAGIQFRNIIENLDGAVMLQNLGLPLEGFPAPLNVRLGIAYQLPLLIDQKLDQFLISLDGRVPMPFDESYTINVGMEYKYHRLIAARAGYKVSTINQLGNQAGLTVGVGLSIANYSLDYSFAPMGELGLTHQIMVSTNFPDKKSSKQRRKKKKIKKHQQRKQLSDMQFLAKDNKLGGMMTSLSGIKLRGPITIKVKAIRDKTNRTGIKRAGFDINVNLDKSIQRWGLKIVDAKGNMVRRYSGEGKPLKIIWKGKNQQGEKIKEAIFCKYELEILFTDGEVEAIKGNLLSGKKGRDERQAARKRLPKIYFKERSSELTSQAINQLDQAAIEISKQPYIKILISGHSDGSAEQDEAFLISKKRIDQVVRYLTATYKISLKTIATRAFGKKKPIASNQTEAGREKNRRVEITIVYKK